MLRIYGQGDGRETWERYTGGELRNALLYKKVKGMADPGAAGATAASLLKW
jgi:hypothetical protein